jgi:hypothetical protein
MTRLPMMFEVGCPLKKLHQQNPQWNQVQQESCKQSPGAIEKIENNSENENVNGPDRNEILYPAAKPMRIFSVKGLVVRIVPDL